MGTILREGDPVYCYFSPSEGRFTVKRHEGKETVYVDAVKALGNDAGTGEMTRVCITVRVPRNPQVGDKFASRAGQKVGILEIIHSCSLSESLVKIFQLVLMVSSSTQIWQLDSKSVVSTLIRAWRERLIFRSIMQYHWMLVS